MPLIFQLQAQEAETLPSYSDKALLPPSVLSSVIETYPVLPQPLIFKATSLEPGQNITTTYIGVREFSLEEDNVALPRSIYSKFKFDEKGDNEHILLLELMDSIPKCTLLKLKPRYFYSEVPNWKFFLEDKLVKSYTILTEGEVLTIDHNGLRIELTVEEMNAKVCSVVETDIVLEVVPLDDDTAEKQMQFTKQEAEAEVEISSSHIRIEGLKPILGNAPEKAKLYKLDLTKIKGNKVTIQLQDVQSNEFDALVNVDLVCGLDRFVGLENFLWTTMDQDIELQKDQEGVHFKHITIDLNNDLIQSKMAKKSNEDDAIFDRYLYLVPFCWEQSASVGLTISNSDLDVKEAIKQSEIELNTKQCSNCLKYIPESKLPLHEAFCLRNNKKCSCGQVFLKHIPDTHWHCPDDNVFGNGQLMKFKHQRMTHHNYQCCGIQFRNFMEMVTTHKATTCQLKLHECKFCHLILPQGEATYKDRFENLTNHENTCGNRTTECYVCNKVLRLKDLPKHMDMHELEKRERASLQKVNFLKCANANCMRLLDSQNRNELDLCEVCYGPLYMAQHDPTNIKLQARLERRYIMQLSRGCGKQWCTNKYCATAHAAQFGAINMKQKLDMVNQELLAEITTPALPINKTRNQYKASNTFWFCVSETILTKKVLIDMLIAEGEYDMEIIYKAGNECSNEGDMRSWLGLHGIRQKGTEGN